MNDLSWNPTTLKLRALIPWERNPKTISKSHAQRLLKLWKKLGQFQTVAIGPGGEVYDGHQRLSVLKAAFGENYEIKALQADRALTEKEREELVIAAHVGTVGTFNWDELSGWDTHDLMEWGLNEETLKGWGGDITALGALLASEEEVPDFEPVGIDEQGRLDQKKPVTCPECGHEFVPK